MKKTVGAEIIEEKKALSQGSGKLPQTIATQEAKGAVQSVDATKYRPRAYSLVLRAHKVRCKV